MNKSLKIRSERAAGAALEVLVHNARGPYHGLPRTAAWGYPEPYTRDLMIAGLGMLVSGDEYLIERLRRVLLVLASNQTEHGHIPSMVHDPHNRGASDTTPLFLLTNACFRQVTGEGDFLEEAARKALTWMAYRSPEDRVIVAQQPTSDWRDEHWVMGHGLFVNAVYHACLKMYGLHERAGVLAGHMNRLMVNYEAAAGRHAEMGLVVPHKPYYGLWSYKIYSNRRFDLLGNSIAVLSGLTSPTRAAQMITWIEHECGAMRSQGTLEGGLPPCLFPSIQPEDADWRPRYGQYNLPGTYHNGGIWPFICGFYIAAAVAAGHPRIAGRSLDALTELVRPAREHDVEFGFNEWFDAKNGLPCGQDWQTWSAGMYLYALESVRRGYAPFFQSLPGHA